MRTIKCKHCETELSSEAERCVKCGHPNSRISITRISILVAIMLAGVWWAMSSRTGTDLRSIQNKVASDAVDEYNIAVTQGDAVQICVQAGLVAAAYLQAKDENNYDLWKQTESSDCRAAIQSK